ncbi:DUF742 domain-containing protein [Actinomadura syzygii]|nr:DUF742 domain-containing protein [Actinomadura syzygii]
MSGEPGAVWITQRDPEVLRPYMLTMGGTRPRHPMRYDTVLNATGRRSGALQPEAATTLDLCRQRARTVVEVAGLLRLPVLVTKIIASGLIDQGVLADPAERPPTDPHSPHNLRHLLDGLQALEVS